MDSPECETNGICSHAQIACSGFQTVADDIFKVTETLINSEVTKRKSGLRDCKACIDSVGRRV